jgi:DNA-binding NarL/FixJ family response regulator
MQEAEITRILFVDNDETAFEFRKCMAKVLGQLPPMELFHASDATEALHILEQVQPHVVVFDDEIPEERELFLESLNGAQPQIVIQTDKTDPASRKAMAHKRVTFLKPSDSLEGIHETFVVAATLANKGVTADPKLLS